MNCLFIKNTEFQVCATDPKKGEVLIKDSRADQLVKEHELLPELEITAVLQNSGKGKLAIQQIAAGNLQASFELQSEPLERSPIRLAVAFARPQTLKKILQIAASFGIKELNFVKTEKVVASYLQSKVLEEQQIEENFILGCQQACEARMPEFQKYFSLNAFIDSCDKSSELIYGDMVQANACTASKRFKTLFLGPEAGLSPQEKIALDRSGFKPVSLGPRMQRVEYAAVGLISKIS